MENRKLLYFVFAFGLVGGLILRLLYASHLPLSNDEGSYLYDGLLLSQGKWPFATSFSRSPALMFLTSIVVKIFGRSFLAGRMISILAGLLSSLVLYFLGRDLFGKKVGLIAFVLYALLAPAVVHTIYLHTEPLELFFVLVGVYFVLRGLEGKEGREGLERYAVAGVFFGLAVLVRETAALYPLVFAVYLSLSELKSATTNRENVASLRSLLFASQKVVAQFIARLKDIFAMVISALVVWGGVWGFIISQVGWEKVKAVFLAIVTMHNTGEYMSFGFALKKKFEIFYGALGENFILYFLAAVFAGVLVLRTRRWRREKKIERGWVFLLLFCAVPFLFYGLYYKRLQAEYLAEFMPALVLMGAVAIDQVIENAKHKLQNAKRPVFLFLIFSFSLLTFNFRYMWLHQHGGTHAPEALEEAVSYVKENVPPDEEIFTAAVIIPFLSGRELSFNMSRPVIFGYPHLKPEVKYALFPSDQEIISHLENKPVNWVVFDRTTLETFSRGHPEIEEYLKKNYNIVKAIPNKRTGTVLEIARR